MDYYTALLMQWGGTDFDYPLTPEQPEPDVSNVLRASGGHLVLTAYKLPLDEPVGHAELTAVNRRHCTCRISRVLVSPAHRGKGLGTEIVRELLRKAFSELRMHRVELEVFDFNTTAIHIYESLGFRREGLRRQSVYFPPEHWNSLMMAILEDEWDAS